MYVIRKYFRPIVAINLCLILTLNLLNESTRVLSSYVAQLPISILGPLSEHVIRPETAACVASAGRNKQPPQQSYLTLAYDIDVNGIAAYIQLG